MAYLNSHNLAAVEFAARKSLRPALNGLYMTPTHTVATDSYLLCEVETPTASGEEYRDLNFDPVDSRIIPADAVVQAGKNLKEIEKRNRGSALADSFSVCAVKETELVTADTAGKSAVSYQKIDGNFPKYESIFPTTAPSATVRFNAENLLMAVEFMQKHARKFQSSGTLTMEVWDKVGGHDYGLLVLHGVTDKGQKIRIMIMPLRNKGEEKELPENA